MKLNIFIWYMLRDSEGIEVFDHYLNSKSVKYKYKGKTYQVSIKQIKG